MKKLMSEVSHNAMVRSLIAYEEQAMIGINQINKRNIKETYGFVAQEVRMLNWSRRCIKTFGAIPAFWARHFV